MKASPQVEQAFSLGVSLQQRGFIKEAQFAFETALAGAPDANGIMSNLGTNLLGQRKFEAALAMLRKAVELGPQDGTFRSNLANCLWRMQRHGEARAEIAIARKLAPNLQGAWHNAGLIEYALGHNTEAVKCYDRCLALAPGRHDVLSDRAMALLAMDHPTAWEANEARWNRLGKHPVWTSGLPQWTGQDLTEKTIYVVFEQGLGDSLQFARYATALQKRFDCKVIFAVQKPLLRLMQINLQMPVVDADKPVPEGCDYFVPLMSIPRWLGFKVATPPPFEYRVPLSQQVVCADGRLRVGIVWAGSPGFESDFQRSMPFLHALELASSKVALYSLQVGPRSADIAEHSAGGLVTDLAPFMIDFAASASLVKQLDVVVAVDTSTLHIAAGCGVPTIAILPYLRCWRWLRNREDSPFYPSLRIVQQKTPGDWAGVMQRVKKLLSVQHKLTA